MPTNLASVQDSTQETPLKRISTEVLKCGCNRNKLSLDNNTDF